MRVFIADDSNALRDQIKEILADIEGIDVVGQARDAPEALESIRKLRPDVAILDIRMPSGSGISVLEPIRKEKIPTKVIIFTNYPYLQLRKEYLDAGADFFFHKAIDFEKLIDVLKRLIPHYQKAKNPRDGANVRFV